MSARDGGLDLDAIADAAQVVANVHSETKGGGGPPSSYCGTCSGDYLMAWPCDAAAQAAETLALVGILQQVLALHRPLTTDVGVDRDPYEYCAHCSDHSLDLMEWPCATVRAIVEGTP